MTQKSSKLTLGMLGKVFGVAFFVYLFFGFMLLPCLNTITQIFTTTDSAGNIDPLAVIRFFFAGSMGRYVWNSLKLAICLVVTVNVVGVSIVLLTEYFDIKGANILRLGYMTTMIYSGVALVTGYLFLYASDGILTTALVNAFPSFDPNWFSGFNAVLFTMTFACTSNHALFLRNAIRGIDYNTVEAARNMGAKPFKVLWKVVFPTLVPTMFSLTVMTFITGLCAMSAPTLLGYDSINPEIVRLAGSSTADEAFPQARAALLSIILAMFTIVLLTVLSAYERKGHYLSVSKTKARLQKQKITNPVWNTLAHIYAYVLFIIYMIPVVMIVIFSFQTYGAIRMKKLDLSNWTLINFFGTQDYQYLTSRGTYKVRKGSISGLFANEATLGGIKMSFVLSILAAALACLIVVIACNYIFKNRNKKSGVVLEYCLLFPWLLPTILICYSYRTYFNAENIWYVGNVNLYFAEHVRILLVLAYTVVKLPFSLRMIKAAFYAIDEELEDAARNMGASGLMTFLRVKRAGGVRAELQRALYRVRYVRHLCQLLRHELRHGHSGHVRGGGTVRLQCQCLGPPLRFDRVHHAGVRRDPLSGLRRGRARPRRAAGGQGAPPQTRGKADGTVQKGARRRGGGSGGSGGRRRCPRRAGRKAVMKINTIVFDMGGVLLDFGAELFSRRLHVGAEGEALLRQHLLCTTDWVRLDRGTITEEEVYAHACARLPAELHAAAEYIIYHWNEPIVPITGTADVVRELKARGYTLYLLSNAARRQHTYWHDIPGSECFSGTLISADVHLLKPEAAIYQALFDKFDLTAASCLFIDDFPPNIEAAENAGMQGIVFHDAGQLREELKARGIL